MIRVTYVLGCHDSRYSEHFEDKAIEDVRREVQTRMGLNKSYFDLQIADGFVRIYTEQVSAIEVQDLSRVEAIREAALKAQEEGV